MQTTIGTSYVGEGPSHVNVPWPKLPFKWHDGHVPWPRPEVLALLQAQCLRDVRDSVRYRFPKLKGSRAVLCTSGHGLV